MDEEARIRNSKKKNAAVKNYKNPEERAKEERERLRLVKAGKAMSGDEAVNENEDYSAIPRPRNRFAVEANRKYKKTAHSGVWVSTMFVHGLVLPSLQLSNLLTTVCRNSTR